MVRTAATSVIPQLPRAWRAGLRAQFAMVLGIVLLGDSAQPARLLSLGLILAGVIGLKLTTPA